MTEVLAKEISVLKMEPGDVLVLRVDEYLSTEAKANLHARVLPLLPAGCKVMVLERAWLSILRPPTETIET